jgi:hypothetical protein
MTARYRRDVEHDGMPIQDNPEGQARPDLRLDRK